MRHIEIIIFVFMGYGPSIYEGVYCLLSFKKLKFIY